MPGKFHATDRVPSWQEGGQARQGGSTEAIFHVEIRELAANPSPGVDRFVYNDNDAPLSHITAGAEHPGVITSSATSAKGGLTVSDGDLTIDHYTLVNCIATGNFTQVWEVAEGASSQSFAMKLLLPEARKDQEQVRVIKAEAKCGKLFDHPNLMKVHFSVVNKQHGYIIMDYFRAANLKTQIHNDITSLHVRIRKLVESTALGLGFMHERGWVHRDVKPDNILFNKGGELRVVDYSLAARAKRRHKEIQGTKSYIAPETLMKKPATAQTDMYSFGITLYLVLTGEFPITGITPSELLKNHMRVVPFPPSRINPNITPEMDAFVLRLVAKKPEDRYQSMAEVYADFRNINVFHEDVEMLQAKKTEADKIERLHGIDAASRLDSRADAERQELMLKEGIAPPPKTPKPAPKPVAAPAAKVASPAPAAPATPPAPAPAMAMQQPFPNQMMPQQPYPNPMMPQQPFYPQPGMMPPPPAGQYPMMGQPYPQFPPGAPGQPQIPQGMPGAPYPQQPPAAQPPPPAAPAPQQASAPAPQQAPAPAPQPSPAPRPAPAAAPTPPPPAEDLEFMDQLPDVI